MLEPTQINALYRAIGMRIKDEREKCHHKQVQFAQLLQISRASLVNIEKGRQRAPIHIVYEIARLLNLPVAELLPELHTISSSEVKKDIQQEIEKKTVGNPDLQEKLLEFVRSHTTATKLSL